MPAQPGSRGDYSHIPIPTYEEAVTSRPASSQNFLGPSEISNDAEREGLLGQTGTDGGPLSSSSPARGYRAPTVESARSSFDDVDGLVVDDENGHGSERESMEELRREMSEMEFEDAPSRFKWSSRLSSGLSSLNLNLPNLQFAVPRQVRAYIPTWSGFRAALPSTEFLRQIKWDLTIIIRILAFIFIFSLGYLVIFSDLFKVRHRPAYSYDPQSVRDFISEHINEGRIRSDLYYITNYDHLAGTEGSYVLGKWIETKWQAMRIGAVEMERFEVFLDYPRDGGRKVAIVEPQDKSWTAKLEEDQVQGENEPVIQQTAVFHGHSSHGNATGHLIYVNHGTNDDFEQLKRLGIKIEGSIVLVRDGGPQPDGAIKIRNAEDRGAVGVLFYSDPADQDQNMDAFGGKWRADGAVQRGSVSNPALVLGDVLSPGYASTPEEKNRLDLTKAKELGYIPRIPSLPLAWHQDGETLLRSLEGIGKKLEEDAPSFVGAVPYIQWWSGNEDSPKVTIENNADEVERQPIYNVFARLEGVEHEEAKVVVGNHRDSWCFGAVDPGSGTAILMEVARIFNELQRAGFRPARTIEFASWDAGTYNNIGSTEHVERVVDETRQNTFAYVNIAAGVFGSDFWANGSPSMQRALFRVLDRLGPDTQNEVTLRKLWNQSGSKLRPLGASSDYAAYQGIGGVASIDLGFAGSSYPRDSCFDTFSSMDALFDPGFRYHRLLTHVITLLVLELSNAPTIPFDFEAYANELDGWVSELEDFAGKETKPPVQVDVKPLRDAVQLMKDTAKQHHQFEEEWDNIVINSAGYEPEAMRAQRLQHIDRTIRFEKDLLDLSEGGGLPGRTQFKHTLFAPDKAHGGEAIVFPAIREAIEAGDKDAAQAQIEKIAGVIGTASTNLVKDLL